MFRRSTRQRHPRIRQRKLSLLTRTWTFTSIICAVAIMSAYVALAAISLSTSSPYNQSFDSMNIPLSDPAPSNLPASFRVEAVGAPRSLGSFSTASVQTSRVAGASMSTTASQGLYNFGSGTSTLGGPDRAPGFLSSSGGTQSGNLYAELINNTGSTLSGVKISYDVEKYRNGSNPSGFRIQLFYSSDGAAWTSAGPDFLTSFLPDLNNNGFATVPGTTVPVVDKTINVSVNDGAKLFLAWNYSVASGSTTTNAQALAVDNVSILGITPTLPTNPSGVGTANPTSVAPTQTSLLTVAVTPGTNPTSVTHTVTANLSALGGSNSQTLFDDGSHGDSTPNDNVFSYLATVAMGTTGGIKNLPFTITETSPLSRTGNGLISFGVLGSTNPSGIGAANPNSVLPGELSVLTVTVSPGTNPPSSGLTVNADLSSIGGSASQLFFDDGASGGDAVASDNVFTYTAAVALGTSAGAKSLPFSITDAQGRLGSDVIALNVQQPPPPVDHLVISQLYGGGGNTGAAYTNDYVELYNPTGVSFNLAGWSLQYASAAGTSWTNKQPLGGTIAPGEYFLVKLGSGGANGSALPAANIEGDINMSASTGKLALVSNSINLSGACPNGVDPDIVDFVGYGTTASCFEGAGRAPAPSATNAIFRKVNGAQDTNQNNTDFQAAPANPRRTAPIVELGPWVAGTEPITDGTNAPYDSTISVDFSEPVDVVGNWYDISCTLSGQHNNATVASYDGFKGYHITPNTSFQFGEQCTVTIFHTQVHDQDLDDGNPETDTLFADHVWTFSVVGAGQPAPYPPSVHLTFGNPSNAVTDLQQPNNYLMEKPTYAVSYNRDKGTPNWVSWHLEQDWFGALARVDTFRADPAVPADWYRVQSTDYFSSGFDRGHMTPNADRDNENRIPINQETYLMSNMVPQAPDNNQGPWAALENDLRTLLNGTQNELYIVSGPLGVGGNGSNGGVTNTLADGHITVPGFTWKVVLMLPKGDNDVSRVTAGSRTIAVMMPNVQGIRNNDWHLYLTTVDAVEQATGYDFFANVPDAVENAIEAGTDGTNPPGTENQFATTAEDTPAGITLNAVSPLLNPTFTSEIINPPSHGVLTGTGVSLTYTPGAEYHGPDSFTFRVNDGSHNSNTSTVNIIVTEVNDPPTANNDLATTDEDTPLNISVADLASNDSTGPADESLQVLSITGVNATVNTHGSVTLDNGVVTYTPEANYHGLASFTYQVCDNAPDSQCSGATVNVTVNSVNDNPVAVADSGTTDEDNSVSVDVVANDTDVDGDNRSLQSVGTAGHGSVAIVGGQALYSPDANFHGNDSFTYVVSDGNGGSATGTVNITVNSVNDSPVAVDDSAATNEDTPVSVDVVANDTDADGDGRTLQSVGTAAHGSVAMMAGQVLYSPNTDFHGADSFTYIVSDGHGGTATGTVNIDVSAVNDSPAAVDDPATTNEDNPVTVDVVANDTDVDGDARTLQSVGTATHGSVTIVSGQAQYSPAADFNGSDSFTYVVSDGHGGTDTGSVNVTVNPVNDAPSANTQSVGTNANTAVPITLTGSDVETAAANLTFVVTVGPAHGSLSGTGANRSYTPALNYSGPDSFKFTVTDDGDGTASPKTSSEATVSITVNDTINPTITAPANLSLGTGTGATNCSLFISDGTLGTANANDNSGAVSIARTGVPAGNIFPVGTTIITYTATDGAGNTNQASQTVTVFDNTAPTFAVPAPVTVNADSNGQGTIPDFASGIAAQDNCGPVTVTQSPVAGTTVGIGTHTVTITARDQAGNTTNATTTFTVRAVGSLSVSLDVTPPKTMRGKSVKLKAVYSNDTGVQQIVTFVFRYSSPCGSFTIGNIGPTAISAGTHGHSTLQFDIPESACTDVYTVTLESYVSGAMIGTTTGTLTVMR